ncbi:MAG: PilZ domain-containing protein [Candidatus Omnitrophica bacterium]|nr:PilZ domain-containing protein [Candidatus Omnitrophota bacterium]
MKEERRKAVRIPTRDSVANCRLLTTESKGLYQFTVWPIRNISAEGIAIFSDEKVSSGSLAFLNVDLDVILRTIGVIAKVIWCKKNKTGYDLGLNFSWWPKPFDKSLVLDFVKQKINDQNYE